MDFSQYSQNFDDFNDFGKFDSDRSEDITKIDVEEYDQDGGDRAASLDYLNDYSSSQYKTTNKELQLFEKDFMDIYNRAREYKQRIAALGQNGGQRKAASSNDLAPKKKRPLNKTIQLMLKLTKTMKESGKYPYIQKQYMQISKLIIDDAKRQKSTTELTDEVEKLALQLVKNPEKYMTQYDKTQGTTGKGKSNGSGNYRNYRNTRNSRGITSNTARSQAAFGNDADDNVSTGSWRGRDSNYRDNYQAKLWRDVPDLNEDDDDYDDEFQSRINGQNGGVDNRNNNGYNGTNDINATYDINNRNNNASYNRRNSNGTNNINATYDNNVGYSGVTGGANGDDYNGTNDIGRRNVNGTYDIDRRNVNGTYDINRRNINGTYDIDRRNINGTNDITRRNTNGTYDIDRRNNNANYNGITGGANGDDYNGTYDINNRNINGTYDINNRNINGTYDINNRNINGTYDINNRNSNTSYNDSTGGIGYNTGNANNDNTGNFGDANNNSSNGGAGNNRNRDTNPRNTNSSYSRIIY